MPGYPVRVLLLKVRCAKSIRTQLAQQDPKRDEDASRWGHIESLIGDIPSRQHVSFACSWRTVFHKANGRVRNNTEFFRLSKALGGRLNSKQNKC